MGDRLTETIDRLQQASTRASGLPVSTGIMFVGPAGTMQDSGLTIPDLLFAAQELRRVRAIDAAPVIAPCVLQDWVRQLSFMQQTVLLTAIRGPDGMPKYGATKFLLRWFRRCVLLSAMDGKVLETPWDNNGGSFTGPSVDLDSVRRDIGLRGTHVVGFPPIASAAAAEEALSAPGGWEARMDALVGQYLRDLDAIPHHFQLHFLHAAEIVGYKHADARIRAWWAKLYVRLVEDMHLHPETEAELDRRLGDNREQWLERADPATRA